MRILFWRKPRMVLVSEREIKHIRQAESEAAGNRVVELDSDDNMPPTALKPLISKRNGRGFKNLTIQGNLMETNLISDVNRRFEESDIVDKRNVD